MERQQRCPYCVDGYLVDTKCTRCGKKVRDENRPLPVGTLLNGQKYRLERALGSGGFGITYRAWDTETGRRVAIKELFPSNSARRYWNTAAIHLVSGQQQYFNYALKNFSREVKTICELRNYPEILRLYSYFGQFGTAYYAMEYLEGEDLGSLLRRVRNISWQQLSRPIWDVLRTLQILHNNDLIHRDISPDNIICLPNGSARLIDFGSVRDYANDTHFTTVIKRSFAPPELFLEQGGQDPRTDIYLLSGTIYYLLSGGKLPKHAHNRLSSLELTGKDALIPLASYSPDAPEHVVRAVERGLSIDIRRRFRDMDEYMSALYPTAPLANETKKQGVRLACARGLFAGQSFPLEQGMVVTLGRGRGNNIAYPEGTKGISHRQCAFFVDTKGIVYIQDEQSRFGTYLGGRKLPPNAWYPLEKYQAIVLGDTAEEFYVV